MTAATLIGMLMVAGFGHPQAVAIERYMEREAGPELDACANSWMGEGLVGVAGEMRRAYHRDLGPGCQSAERQVMWLAREWPRRYPFCAARFAAGDLSAWQRCWGEGRGR